ncbi:DUF4469 domain-containing protein [Marinilabiliaceae bacterium JC017]|nr:DUF4469 domain-containing protein [Marinilabiliaceae bacterium JC017]
MGLLYALYPNSLTENPDDRRAVIQKKKVLTIDDLIKKMTGRGLTLTDTEALSVLNEESHAILDSLKQGYVVVTPLMTITPSIRGTFMGDDDEFDPSRHSIEFNVRLGNSLKFDTNEIELQKIKTPIKSPVILEVKDHFSETQNKCITPKGTLELRGIDLKVNTEVDDEGLFFHVNGTTLRADIYFNNTNTLLQVKVPAELTGTNCQLEVRKRFRFNQKLYASIFDNEFIIKS